MSDEEKPLELRDKIAIEIINALIIGDPSYHKTKESDSYTSYDHTGTAKSLIDNFNSNYPTNKEFAIKDMEEIARTAYKMADVIRKVRIAVFE